MDNWKSKRLSGLNSQRANESELVGATVGSLLIATSPLSNCLLALNRHIDEMPGFAYARFWPEKTEFFCCECILKSVAPADQFVGNRTTRPFTPFLQRKRKTALSLTHKPGGRLV